MSVDPTKELAAVTSAIDIRQTEMALLEIALNDAIAGDNLEQMAVLRTEAAALKAAIGQLRNTQSFWVQEQKEEQQARQKQGELGKV